jgi:hypothetical protein
MQLYESCCPSSKLECQQSISLLSRLSRLSSFSRSGEDGLGLTGCHPAASQLLQHVSSKCPSRGQYSHAPTSSHYHAHCAAGSTLSELLKSHPVPGLEHCNQVWLLDVPARPWCNGQGNKLLQSSLCERPLAGLIRNLSTYVCIFRAGATLVAVLDNNVCAVGHQSLQALMAAVNNHTGTSSIILKARALDVLGRVG